MDDRATVLFRSYVPHVRTGNDVEGRPATTAASALASFPSAYMDEKIGERTMFGWDIQVTAAEKKSARDHIETSLVDDGGFLGGSHRLGTMS